MFLKATPLEDVDWWCERIKRWQCAKDTFAWRPNAQPRHPRPIYSASTQEVAASSQEVCAQPSGYFFITTCTQKVITVNQSSV